MPRNNLGITSVIRRVIEEYLPLVYCLLILKSINWIAVLNFVLLKRLILYGCRLYNIKTDSSNEFQALSKFLAR